MNTPEQKEAINGKQTFKAKMFSKSGLCGLAYQHLGEGFGVYHTLCDDENTFEVGQELEGTYMPDGSIKFRPIY
jgi:hypothetical protein